MKKIFFILLLSLILILGGCLNNVSNNKTVVCQKDAKICSDGSVVVRIGDNCNFDNCPLNTTISKTKLKICPDVLFENKMPQVIDKNQTPKINKYFIINGKREEINNYDLNWIKLNCNVKEQIVY